MTTSQITEEEFRQVLREGMPAGAAMPFQVVSLERGRVVLRLSTGTDDLRPGGTVAGPELANHLIERKGRLQPGRMFLVDTGAGQIVDDAEIKAGLAATAPYGEWLEEHLLHIADLPPKRALVPHQRRASQGERRVSGRCAGSRSVSARRRLGPSRDHRYRTVPLLAREQSHAEGATPS